MDLTERIEAELKMVREALFRLLRIGVVDSTQPKQGTVRVKFSDQEGVVTWECQVLFAKTHKDKAYWMPDVGDQVAVLCLPYGSSQAFVLGAVYSDKDAVPVQSQDKRHVRFEDGSWLEYDRKEHNLHGHIKGKVDDLTIDEDVNIKVGGNAKIEVTGNADIIVSGDLTGKASFIHLNP